MTNSKLAGWRGVAAVMGLLCVCVTAPAQELELDLRLREAVPHLVADKPSLNHSTPAATTS